jgi:inhibitor of KinA
MPEQDPLYHIFPLGDNAITIEFGNQIDVGINAKVLSYYNNLQQDPLPGMLEVVPAYSSLTIYYKTADIRRNIPANSTAYTWIKELVKKRLAVTLQITERAARQIKIPVCYDQEMAPDTEALAAARGLSADEVKEIHCSKIYRVYMLGFLPGFAYMGQVDERIEMPRKPKPQHTLAGSVGIAGRQTGIYPLHSPGGWSIIGRTPLKLFEMHKEDPTLLQAGDAVEFYPITKKEFENMTAAEVLKNL